VEEVLHHDQYFIRSNRSLPPRGGTSGRSPQPFLPGGMSMVTMIRM